jgi:MFS family permease
MSFVRRWLVMTVLSFSGGIIFLLPFLREIYYRPMAGALSLTNTELGVLMSVFGFTSMVAYFPGGWLADRVSPRKLMTTSLIVTGLAGLYFATFPTYEVSIAIHAFWGVSITLLFWGAMIRVTRNWAPADQQGRAFGWLESLRGVGEVLTSSGLLLVFAWLGSGEKAMSVVIVQLSSIVIALGVLSWFVIEDIAAETSGEEKKKKVGWHEVIGLLRMPVIWMISCVVLCGYCAYWTSFYFTPYASDVFLTTAAVAGAIGVGRMWLKPIAAVIAGYVADRFGVAISISVLFIVLIGSFVVFAVLPGTPEMFYFMLVNVAIAGIAIFAIRGIYFALLEEGGIPLAVTGTAAGIVSAVGFTPDIFMPLLGGVLLDTYPGIEGYRYFYLVTAVICGLGLCASLLIYFKYVRNNAATSNVAHVVTS